MDQISTVGLRLFVDVGNARLGLLLLSEWARSVRRDCGNGRQLQWSPTGGRNPAHVQPSDDQNPVPVYCLAVKSGAVFEFPFRVTPWRYEEPWRDEPERQRAAAFGETTHAQVQAQVRKWLTDGLTIWGAGAKTAAGYGYFEIVTQGSGNNHAKPKTPKRQGGNGGDRK